MCLLVLLIGGVPLHRGRSLDHRVLHHRDAEAGQAAQLRAGDLHDGEDGSRQAHRRLQLHGHLGLQREVRRALGLHRQHQGRHCQIKLDRHVWHKPSKQIKHSIAARGKKTLEWNYERNNNVCIFMTEVLNPVKTEDLKICFISSHNSSMSGISQNMLCRIASSCCFDFLHGFLCFLQFWENRSRTDSLNI